MASENRVPVLKHSKRSQRVANKGPEVIRSDSIIIFHSKAKEQVSSGKKAAEDNSGRKRSERSDHSRKKSIK